MVLCAYNEVGCM